MFENPFSKWRKVHIPATFLASQTLKYTLDGKVIERIIEHISNFIELYCTISNYFYYICQVKLVIVKYKLT